VAILIYNRDQNSFVLVKQFRPPVFLKDEKGFTYELCAGITDKESTLEQIAIEEILEETGYKVGPEALEKITSFYTAVGFAGSQQTLFFAEVRDAQQVEEGGGVDLEEIEVVHLPLKEAEKMMYDESLPKTPGLMFGFLWFFQKKKVTDC